MRIEDVDFASLPKLQLQTPSGILVEQPIPTLEDVLRCGSCCLPLASFCDKRITVRECGSSSSTQPHQSPCTNTLLVFHLRTLFREFGSHPLQIDIKTHTPGLVREVHNLIQRYGCSKNVLWGSFKHEVGAISVAVCLCLAAAT